MRHCTPPACLWTKVLSAASSGSEQRFSLGCQVTSIAQHTRHCSSRLQCSARPSCVRKRVACHLQTTNFFVLFCFSTHPPHCTAHCINQRCYIAHWASATSCIGLINTHSYTRFHCSVFCFSTFCTAEQSHASPVSRKQFPRTRNGALHQSPNVLRTVLCLLHQDLPLLSW